VQNLAYCYWPAIAPRLASPLLPVQLGSLCRAVVLGYDRPAKATKIDFFHVLFPLLSGN
jgi:hypothetical protein